MTPTAQQLASAVRGLQRSAGDVCRAALQQIQARNPQLNAFTDLLADEALERATVLDARIAAGEDPGPLAGVPIAVKSNICTRIGRTSCGSRMLEEYCSPYDATAVVRLLDAGAVLIGKTNMDEFGMGSSNENSAFGAVHHPVRPECTPGGSSGGSAAAVAADLCAAALGSDTGGSIRLPASFCGVVGLKPTYGRVSRYGLVAYGSSLDQIGPITSSVTDAALLLQVMAGHDPRDSTSSPQPVARYVEACGDAAVDQAQRTLRVGIVREHFSAGLQPAVRDALESAIAGLRSAGAAIHDVSLPHAHLSVAAYYVIAVAEASSNLARYDGVHYGRRAATAEGLESLYTLSRSEGFGPEVQRRILLGTFILSAGYHQGYYQQAQRVRRLIQQDYLAALREVDVILTPTSPTVAFCLGEKTADPLSMYLTDVCTTGVNLAGVPAISVPCGMDPRGLSIGAQLVGAPFGEAALFTAARLLERVLR